MRADANASALARMPAAALAEIAARCGAVLAHFGYAGDPPEAAAAADRPDAMTAVAAARRRYRSGTRSGTGQTPRSSPIEAGGTGRGPARWRRRARSLRPVVPGRRYPDRVNGASGFRPSRPQGRAAAPPGARAGARAAAPAPAGARRQLEPDPGLAPQRLLVVFLITLVLPVSFDLAGLQLNAYNSMLIVCIIPAFLYLHAAAGRAGRRARRLHGAARALARGGDLPRHGSVRIVFIINQSLVLFGAYFSAGCWCAAPRTTGGCSASCCASCWCSARSPSSSSPATSR